MISFQDNVTYLTNKNDNAQINTQSSNKCLKLFTCCPKHQINNIVKIVYWAAIFPKTLLYDREHSQWYSFIPYSDDQNVMTQSLLKPHLFLMLTLLHPCPGRWRNRAKSHLGNTGSRLAKGAAPMTTHSRWEEENSHQFQWPNPKQLGPKHGEGNNGPILDSIIGFALYELYFLNTRNLCGRRQSALRSWRRHWGRAYRWLRRERWCWHRRRRHVLTRRNRCGK